MNESLAHHLVRRKRYIQRRVELRRNDEVFLDAMGV